MFHAAYTANLRFEVYSYFERWVNEANKEREVPLTSILNKTFRLLSDEFIDHSI